jgi:hypothetical protein
MCNLSLFSEIPDNSNNIIFVFDIKTHNSFVIIKDRNVLSFEIKKTFCFDVDNKWMSDRRCC